jgi:hypothetical protein
MPLILHFGGEESLTMETGQETRQAPAHGVGAWKLLAAALLGAIVTMVVMDRRVQRYQLFSIPSLRILYKIDTMSGRTWVCKLDSLLESGVLEQGDWIKLENTESALTRQDKALDLYIGKPTQESGH